MNTQINTQINTYAKVNNIDSNKLENICDEFLLNKTYSNQSVEELVAEQNFRGKFLVVTPMKKEFRENLKSFIDGLYDEFGHIYEAEHKANMPTKEQLAESQLNLEKMKELQAIQKSLEEKSRLNWESFKSNNPIVETYTKETIIDALINKSYVEYAFDNFKSKEHLQANIFYHGTKSNMVEIEGLKPSIILGDDVELGGGYGVKYYGISLSEDRAISAHFTSITDGANVGTIFTVLLAPDAKVLHLPSCDDSVEIEENIVEYWNHGIDAIKLADNGEKELVILNPGAVKIVGKTVQHGFKDIQNISTIETAQLFEQYKSVDIVK